MLSPVGRTLNRCAGSGLGYREGTMPMLARISVTPVKGTVVQHPDSAMLTELGIPGNRLFYIVDERGDLLSGTEFGPLVRIMATYEREEERLRLRFPDGSEVEGAADALGQAETTDFYGRAVRARVLEGPFAEALSSFCPRRVRLLRCDRDGDGADVEPITILSFASVRDLGERGGYDGDLDARRFRLNLELDGCDPYEEDSWHGRRVEVGEATIEVGEQVPRCAFTQKDPDTGERDWDTLTQIAKLRPRVRGGKGLPFGVYARVVVPGTVRVGDHVSPLGSA
jgi:uncharacterized protein